jgi:rhodanese-related sulfurtransferase
MKPIAAALLLGFTLLCAAPSAHAAESSFRYVTARDLAAKLKAKEPVLLVDIQVEPEYAQHHIKAAIPTYSYPVKSAEEKAKIDAVLPNLKSSAAPVVVVCPRGAGGAERAYRYLEEKGVSAERLYILEKGQAGWTYADLIEGK